MLPGERSGIGCWHLPILCLALGNSRKSLRKAIGMMSNKTLTSDLHSPAQASAPTLLNSGMQASCLIAALFEPVSRDHFLELRLIFTNGRVTQVFHQVRALLERGWAVPGLQQLDGIANIHYGVVPRIRKGGTSSDCAPATAVWADLDSGLPVSIPLPPSVQVESSPGKYQAFWLLDRPCGDLSRIELLNRAIAVIVDADLRGFFSSGVLFNS